jgi:hypothetical protein
MAKEATMHELNGCRGGRVGCVLAVAQAKAGSSEGFRSATLCLKSVAAVDAAVSINPKALAQL